MNFAHPDRLYLLALIVPFIIFLWYSVIAKNKALEKFGDPEILERIGMAVRNKFRTFKSILIVSAFILLIIALAAPQWGATREKIERKGVDIVVAVDTSLSMLARDVAPSRLARSKRAIENLIEMMQGDRIGLVAFSGLAMSACPLTLDYSAARMFTEVIDTNIIPIPGTNISDALAQASLSFDKNQKKHKVVILITDGENLEKEGDPVAKAEELAKEGVIIYTIGVGTPGGTSIPVETKDGVFDKTDNKSKVVITKLDETSLRKIALAGGGKYRRLDNFSKGDELTSIYQSIASMEKKTFDEQYQVHYEDRFQYFLGAAFFLLAVEMFLPERKKRKAR